MKKGNYIRASEMQSWSFCPKQWYLCRTTGKKPDSPAIQKGKAYHVQESKSVRNVQRTQKSIVKYALIGGAIACLLWYLSLQ